MLPAVTQDPSPRWSIRVEAGSDEADLPAATTTSVPVAGCKRGAAHNTTTARMATTAAAIHRIRGRELRRGPGDGSSAPRRATLWPTPSPAPPPTVKLPPAPLLGSPPAGPPPSPHISPP